MADKKKKLAERAARTDSAKDGSTTPASDRETPKPVLAPVLASEALKDDLAPVEPWSAAGRYWCAVFAAVFVALGLSISLTGAVPVPVGDATVHYVLGAVALAIAIVPFRYPIRATAMIALAGCCGVLGIAGIGPASEIAHGTGEWGILHLLAVLGLPAALLFRARYRAYRGARLVLLAALLMAIPFGVYCGVSLAQGDHLALQIASGVALATICLSLVGFMGSETTGGGGAMAVATIIAVNGQLVTEGIVHQGPTYPVLAVVWSVASLSAFLGTAILGSLGLFQLLAWRLGPDARAIDIRRPLVADRPRIQSLTEWFSRK